MRRWSSLQRQIYQIVAPAIDLQIHCRVYRMQSQRGSAGLPRYWITLGQEIIWDYPKKFVETPRHASRKPIHHYPYCTDIPAISALLREYIDTPAKDLLDKTFASDQWGLANILRAADRRIGSRQWPRLRKKLHNEAALKVLKRRMEQASSSKARVSTAARP